MILESTIKAFADLLWPPKCAACSARILSSAAQKGDPFCRACADTLLYINDPMCTKCGMPFEGAGQSHLCLNCGTDPPPFEKARAVFHYGGAAAQAIQRFKYGGAGELAKPLGRILGELARREIQADAVIPVPLHDKKLLKRGFNQSALLARYAADSLDVPLVAGNLRRTRNTASQAGLSRAERMTNIRGAFEARNPRKLEGLKILLVDDVITSSATVREAADALLKAGCGSVQVAALARATGSASLLAPLGKKK